MPPHRNDSVTDWLGRLKSGDEEAARLLWDRYFDELIRLARSRLKIPGGAADADDVVQSAFLSLCAGAKDGCFPGLENRDSLWKLLFTIVVRKAANIARRESRPTKHSQKLREQAEVACVAIGGGVEHLTARGPGPELVVLWADQFVHIMDSLSTSLRKVAELLLEGQSNSEIAESMGCSQATVGRRIQALRATLTHLEQE